MLECKSPSNMFKCIHMSHKSHFSLKNGSPVGLLCSCGVKVSLHTHSKVFIFFFWVVSIPFFIFHVLLSLFSHFGGVYLLSA